jgi:hypothetical protein
MHQHILVRNTLHGASITSFPAKDLTLFDGLFSKPQAITNTVGQEIAKVLTPESGTSPLVRHMLENPNLLEAYIQHMRNPRLSIGCEHAKIKRIEYRDLKKPPRAV